MANGNATIIVGSARLGSARLGFLRLPEGWWFDIEVLTTTGKSIFSG